MSGGLVFLGGTMGKPNFIALTMVLAFCVACSKTSTDKKTDVFSENGTLIPQSLLEASHEVERQALDTIEDFSTLDQDLNYEVVEEVPKLQPNNEAKKLIFAAIRENNFDELKSLLDRYSIAGLVDKSSYSPLIRAVRHGANAGNTAIVKLLSLNPEVDINEQDGYGYSALTWAAIESSYNAINILLEAHERPDPNVRDMNGRTPLIWSIFAQYIEKNQNSTGAIQALLNAPGVDVNANDNIMGWNALMYAVRLPGKGADPNVVDDRYTNERLDLVELLVKSGADIGDQDSSGFTAYDWARAYNKSSEMQNLLSRRPRVVADQ